MISAHVSRETFSLAIVAVLAVSSPASAGAERAHFHKRIWHQRVWHPHIGERARAVAVRHVAVPAAYDWSGEPGSVVEIAAGRARREPGVTLEYDPTAKLSATGGPSGGIPLSGGGP